MSGFSEHADGGRAQMEAVFGEVATYRQPYTGGRIYEGIVVRLGPVSERSDTDAAGNLGRVAVRSIVVGLGGDGDVERVAVNDEVDVAGETWAVVAIEHQSETHCRAELMRRTSHRRGRVQQQ
jgi:hypothetical protein